MTKQISLPYGHSTLTVNVPEEQLAWVLSPNEVSALEDVDGAARRALRHPLGCAPLAEMVRGKAEDVVVLVDDGTRPTPQHLLLPAVLDELNAAGVPDEQITLLIALGTHRPLTEDEMRARYGASVVERVRVENLDNHNPDAFVDFETTASGIPIQVAKRYAEASFVMAVGNIVPHMYCGWAGGCKIVQPGVCSPITTAETHLLAAPLVRTILGDIDNPVRREIDEIGQRTGLAFILNTVLNRSGEVAHLVAGQPVIAHRHGVKLARAVYGVRYDEAVDVVFASSHPADRDFWQGVKALNGAGLTVKEGGTVVLLNPAPEGVAPDHPAMVDMGTTSIPDIVAGIRRGEVEDKVAASTYQAMAATREHARVVIVSDPCATSDLEQMGLNWCAQAQQALDEALAAAGPDARLGIITHAADLLPIRA
jgi:nickel-dependent lactate racemase